MTEDNYYEGVSHSEGSQQQQEQQSTTTKTPVVRPQQLRRRVSIGDLFNPTNPWILQGDGQFLPMFNYVPKHLRTGPWSPLAKLALFAMTYGTVMVLIGANIQHYNNNNDNNYYYYYSIHGRGLMDDFRLAPDAYPAYTVGWYYNTLTFLWMCYVAWLVRTESALSSIAWVTFTLWSWTIITIRHGLCVLAPFVPSIRIFCEVLRLPVLLSASITFGVWNFILLPGIAIFLINDHTKRKKFIEYMTNFRLTQLHVFNVVFATLNGYYIEPRRPLQMGDINVIAIYMASYLIFYYFVLDRIGIHLYPIFSPRASWVIGSWIFLIMVCWGGYQFWETALSARA